MGNVKISVLGGGGPWNSREASLVFSLLQPGHRTAAATRRRREPPPKNKGELRELREGWRISEGWRHMWEGLAEFRGWTLKVQIHNASLAALAAGLPSATKITELEAIWIRNSIQLETTLNWRRGWSQETSEVTRALGRTNGLLCEVLIMREAER